MSTVLALIFSVALLVLSMVANLFGPRLLYRFVQDWVTQVCIGLFMAAFIYVFLVFLVTHQDNQGSFIPQVSLITSWFLVLGAFGFLVFYSHRVATLIQNPDAIGRIVEDLHVGIRRQSLLTAQEVSFQPNHDPEPRTSDSDFEYIYSEGSGYLQDINQRALVRAAATANASISFEFRPGQFVLKGEALGLVSPASATPMLNRAVLQHVHLGRHRVLSQDLEFGLAQIVEVAIRALSPAVNDTFTGVACVDLLGEALIALAVAPQWAGNCFDSDNIARVYIPPLQLARLVKQAFDQVRQAAADNPAVSIRLLSILGRISQHFTRVEDHNALLDQVNAVWETVTLKQLPAMDFKDIEVARRKSLAMITRHSASGSRISRTPS